MLRKIALVLSAVSFAFLVLVVSILRCSAVSYSASASPSPTPPTDSSQEDKIEINYLLPYPGKILPDSPFWYAKALRDKIWFLVTSNPTRKAELLVLFADKRLLSSKILFEKDKPAIALSTLTKAEKYLEKALLLEKKNRGKGVETKEFLLRLANASLKHRQVIEEILTIAPEDTRPQVIKVGDYAKNVFKESRDALQSLGVPAPENPFDSE